MGCYQGSATTENQILPNQAKKDLNPIQEKTNQAMKIASINLKTQKLQQDKTKETKFITNNRDDYQRYSDIINECLQSDKKSAQKVVRLLFEHYEGELTQKQRDKQKLIQLSKGQYPSLKMFVFLYANTNFCFKVNNQLSRKSYNTISIIIAQIKKELKNTEEFKTKIKTNTIFYRAINHEENQLEQGSRIFTKTFQSCCRTKENASKLGNFVYHIKLDQKNPHDYIMVPKYLTKYKEQSVILLPYLPMECISVNEKQKKLQLMQIAAQKVFEQNPKSHNDNQN